MWQALLELEWGMKTLYMACAAGGGAVLIVQTLLLLLGFGDADVDLDSPDDVDAGDGSFSVLSLRAVVSFFTFFGLTGWLGINQGWGDIVTLTAATGSGLVLMLAVAWLMHMQSKLQSQGNIDPKNAVGKTARVYLRIPAENSGFGKIQVKVQSRTAEFSAFTNGVELPTGATVRIARMTTPDTFEVVPLTEE